MLNLHPEGGLSFENVKTEVEKKKITMCKIQAAQRVVVAKSEGCPLERHS